MKQDRKRQKRERKIKNDRRERRLTIEGLMRYLPALSRKLIEG